MNKIGSYIQYYVEGEDEEKLISVLKTDLHMVIPGKISKFNAVQNRLTKARLMNLRSDTTVVLVFDTDTGNIDILNENIKKLKSASAVRSIICVTQVKNLEDELIRSTDIKYMRELTGSKSNSGYKKDLIKTSNLAILLTRHGFEIKCFWAKEPDGVFAKIPNEASLIKIEN
ncbi:MAG: hypothetical protein K5894_16270 [Lachnospiraceae bacterium]|nr:hypothetical protein [Lachnospiraceae bacterium]MDN4745002.1 hypothetical protein [Lachnospiraceae bacterium C1.1]